MGYAVCIIFLVCMVFGVFLLGCLAYKKFVNDGYNVRIDVYKGYAAIGATMMDARSEGTGEHMLIIKFTNIGSETIHLESPEIRLTDGMIVSIPGYVDLESCLVFPLRIEKGRSYSVTYPWYKIQNLFRNAGYSKSVGVKAEVRDKTGREFVSDKVLLVDLED